MLTLIQLAGTRWITPPGRNAPSIRGVPFKLSDSSSGHQRFNESTDDHSVIRVKERDMCVNFKGT